jgi:tetratricopeptide (TPR) repeat protein
VFRFNKVFFFLGLCLLSFCPVYGGDDISSIFELYKNGDYHGSIKALTILGRSPKHTARSFYWKGLCYNRLQKYPKAKKSFLSARRHGLNTRKYKDYHYEFGQTYYALNELDKSSKEFEKSVKLNFKTGNSLYYRAFIYQTLEENKKALKVYKKMVKDQSVDKGLIQSARYQMAEINSSILLTKPVTLQKNLAIKKLIPSYQLAINILPDSSIAGEIKGKINRIKDRYDLHTDRMINGKKYPSKQLAVNFLQDYTYDSNILLEAEDATSTSTNKDTFLANSSLTVKWTSYFKRKFFVKPQLKIANAYHFTRDVSSVYENDSLTYTPAVKSSYEHTLFDKQASLIFDLEYARVYKDFNKRKRKNYYSQATTITIGEKFKLFSLGKTTLKLKYKKLDSYVDSSDVDTYSLNSSQAMSGFGKGLLLLAFNADIARFTSPSSDTNTFLLRADYIWSKFYRDVRLWPSLALTALDPINQSDTRGIEKTINPGIKLVRQYGDHFTLTTSYAYTKKISKSKDSFDYHKHVLLIEADVSY